MTDPNTIEQRARELLADEYGCNQSEILPEEIRAAAAALRSVEADAELADTQRAIIEAAERRGYERGLSERPAMVVTDEDLAHLAAEIRELPVPKRGFHAGWRDEEIWEWATRGSSKLVESFAARKAGGGA